MAITLGQNISVMFGLQLPLTRKLWVTLFETLQIKWEVKYFIKKSSCVFLCASFITASLSSCVCLLLCHYDAAWCCRWLYNTNREWRFKRLARSKGWQGWMDGKRERDIHAVSTSWSSSSPYVFIKLQYQIIPSNTNNFPEIISFQVSNNILIKQFFVITVLKNNLLYCMKCTSWIRIILDIYLFDPQTGP